jgi:hypothetical protein
MYKEIFLYGKIKNFDFYWVYGTRVFYLRMIKDLKYVRNLLKLPHFFYLFKKQIFYTGILEGLNEDVQSIQSEAINYYYTSKDNRVVKNFRFAGYIFFSLSLYPVCFSCFLYLKLICVLILSFLLLVWYLIKFFVFSYFISKFTICGMYSLISSSMAVIGTYYANTILNFYDNVVCITYFYKFKNFKYKNIVLSKFNFLHMDMWINTIQNEIYIEFPNLILIKKFQTKYTAELLITRNDDKENTPEMIIIIDTFESNLRATCWSKSNNKKYKFLNLCSSSSSSSSSSSTCSTT